jgi:hypothetical protein
MHPPPVQQREHTLHCCLGVAYLWELQRGLADADGSKQDAKEGLEHGVKVGAAVPAGA